MLYFRFLSTGLDIHLIESCFSYIASPTGPSVEQKRFCDSIMSPGRAEVKIRAVKPLPIAALSSISSLRNILEHGHAGFNVNGADPHGNPLSRRELLTKLCENVKQFLGALCFGDKTFSRHAGFGTHCADLRNLLELCDVACASSSLGENLDSKSLKFSVPVSGLYQGSRLLRLSAARSANASSSLNSSLCLGREDSILQLHQQMCRERSRVLVPARPGYGIILSCVLFYFEISSYWKIFFLKCICLFKCYVDAFLAY